MTYYRTDGTTRGHGILGGLFSLLILGGCIAFFIITLSEHSKEALAAFCFIGFPMTIVAGWAFAFSLRHALQPQNTFVEITDDRLVWRDWDAYGMKSVEYPLTAIWALKRPDEGSDCIILDDGTCVALPILDIRKYAEFIQALRQAAPTIQILDSHEMPMS